MIVMEESLKTLIEMVEEASVAGYGTPKSLLSRFRKWEQYGLIGPPVRKEARLGGASLWHPMQVSLFEFYLANRREGINLITLSNAPVGLWLLDSDGQWGIETRQAQRALLYGYAS